MANEFTRNLEDADFVSTVANAAAGANSATFDLGQTLGGLIENIEFELTTPAEAGLSDTKVLTYTFKDSADGVTFAAVSPAIAYAYTGTGGTGYPANVLRFRGNSSLRRYVRVEQTVTATPGTLAASFTFKVKF